VLYRFVWLVPGRLMLLRALRPGQSARAGGIRFEDGCQGQRLWRDGVDPIPEIDAAIARAWSSALGLHADGLGCRVERTGVAWLRWTFGAGAR
jgi:hypothetical protein